MLGNNEQKSTGKRKSIMGIAVVLAILMAVIVGIGTYNAPDNRLTRQLEIADKYLAEGNYEQAIVEYMKAIEIDSKSQEAMSGLENTCLAYAQSLVAAGDFEKAVSILKTGYTLTGRENLRLKIKETEELEEQSQIIEMPFDITDITIKGYDLLDNHFEEVCKAFQVGEWREDGDGLRSLTRLNEYKSVEAYSDPTMKYMHINMSSNFSAGIDYDVFEDEIHLSMYSDDLGEGIDWREYITFPIVPGDSYEDWCQIMQFDSIKEKGKKESGESWEIRTGWGEEYATYAETECNLKKSYVLHAERVYGDDIFSIQVVVESDGSISRVMFQYYLEEVGLKKEK